MQISIITINYNDLAGLKKTMTSVLTQTYNNVQYIIIDGGSTDGSKEYIESHKDQLAYWVSEPDNGIYNAMNKGIDKATGEYLLFLNGGDWLVDNTIINKVTKKFNGTDILYGNLIKEFSKNKTILDKGPRGKEITFYTFLEGTLNHPATFIRRSLFDKFGYYDETLEIVSDWKFFLISIGLNDATVKYLNQDVAYFNMAGVSNSNLEMRNKEREQVLQELVPSRILKDYKKMSLNNKIIKNPRVQMLLAIECSRIAKKINALWLKLLNWIV